MADPLSLLRQYNVNKKEVVEKNGYVCFGEYCWPKTVKTNYLAWRSSKDGPNKDYYTLECLLFILRNVNLQHPVYVKQAAADRVPVVRRPDRKDLLAYLSGESATSASIDRSAPLELPVPTSDVLKSSDDLSADKGSSSSLLSGSLNSSDDGGPTPSKISRQDVMQRAKEQFSARLDAPKIKKAISAGDGVNAGGNELPFSASESLRAGTLSDAMSSEKIAALKAKRLAKKRSTIIDAENEFEKDGAQNSGSTTGPSILFKYDADFTREIQSKERVWRNRSTILQATGKNFMKSVMPLLQGIKSREDGGKKPNPNATQSVTGGGAAGPGGQRLPTPGALMPQNLSQQQYNRYDQERFHRNESEFQINTTGSYHGLTLKSVTEGSVTPKAASNQSHGNSAHPMSNQLANSKPKRISKTPIIIIPTTTTSLITMFNARAILQELRFQEGKLCDQKRESETLIQRRKPDNTTVPYRIIDSPLKLAPHDWDRVVAVFVQGPAWQFKGWPWDGNPVEIFSRIKAFHLKWDEMKLDTNVAKWSVEVIELSRTKRHLDRANLLKFWSMLDAFMVKHKHFLRT